MSNANTATAFRRTEAGADELTQPKLGLSVPQRKMLRCCGTATSLNDIERLFAAEEAHYSRERFDRDLEKLEQYGLIQRTGAALKIVHTKPSAATIALPPQIKPTAQRGPELRTVSTAQPQPQRIVHALIGAGVMVLAGTVFWLMSGPAPEQPQPAPGAAAASGSADSYPDPVFIDEPPPEPTRATSGKNAAPVKAARPTDAQRAAKPQLAAANQNHPKTAQAATPQLTPAVAIAVPASQPQAVAADSQRNVRPPEATSTESQPARPAAVSGLATTIKPVGQPAPAPQTAVALPQAAVPAPAVAVAAVARPAEPAPALQRETETAVKAEKKPASNGPRLTYREKAEFPPEALLSDIRKGSVRARLAIDESGNVTDVTIVGAQGGRLFSRPAIAALKKWRYEPTGQRETTVAEIEFRE